MKRIYVLWTDELSGTTTERVLATNPSGSGLFMRDPNDGAYSQLRGNDQTPTFRTPAQLMNYVRREICESGIVSIKMVRGSAVGWPTREQSAAARALRAIPSAARAQASRENGRKGGRPQKSS